MGRYGLLSVCEEATLGHACQVSFPAPHIVRHVETAIAAAPVEKVGVAVVARADDVTVEVSIPTS